MIRFELQHAQSSGWHVIARHPDLFDGRWQWSEPLGLRRPSALKIEQAKLVLRSVLLNEALKKAEVAVRTVVR